MPACNRVMETETEKEAANGQQKEGGDAGGGSLHLYWRTHAVSHRVCRSIPSTFPPVTYLKHIEITRAQHYIL